MAKSKIKDKASKKALSNSTTGNLVDRLGNIQGTITYATGAVEVTPIINVTSWQTIYSPQTYYVSS